METFPDCSLYNRIDEWNIQFLPNSIQESIDTIVSLLFMKMFNYYFCFQVIFRKEYRAVFFVGKSAKF